MTSLIEAPGVWYFLTISLVNDFTPNDMIKKWLIKQFPIGIATLEHGDPLNPKQHLHLVGNSLTRGDNLKSRLKSLLVKHNYEIDDQYSVHMIATPKPMIEIGYITKESDHILVFNNDISDAVLKQARELYDSKPKRDRKEKRGTFKEEDFVQSIVESCRTRSEIAQYIKDCKKDGKLPWLSYKKINWKSLAQYVLDETDLG